MKSSLLSTREKLLLGLLCSSMVFSLSFSFSYGAVNQTKVDSIMKMISDAATKFSDVIASGQSKSERTLYYEKVDAGLGDAVEMLAVVRNKIRSDFLGLSPAYTADEIVGAIIGGVIGNPGTGNPGSGTNPGTAVTNLCPAGQNYPDYVYGTNRIDISPLTPTKTYTIQLNLKGSTKGLALSALPRITTAESPRNLAATKYITISRNPCDFGSSAKIFFTDVVDGWKYFSVNDARTDAGVLNLSSGTWYINVKLAGACVTPGLPANSPNQNNCGSLIEIPSGGMGYISTETNPGTGTSGGTNTSSSGNGVFIYRVKTATSQDALNKAQADNNALQCISSLDELRRINPDTVGPNNPNGYEYATYKGLGKDCYFNVKDHNNVKAWSKNPEIKNRSENIPDSCRIGTKFVAWAKNGIVLAECVSKEYAYGIGKTAPNCTDDANAVVFDLNKMRGNTTFPTESVKDDISGKDLLLLNEGSYAKGWKGALIFHKENASSKPPVVSIRIDLRDGKFDPGILPKRITTQDQNDDYPTYGANWYTNDFTWQNYGQMSTEVASLSQCAGDFTSSEARLLGGYRTDTPISTFSQLIMGQLDHPFRKLQLLEGGDKITSDTKDVFLQPGSVWYLNYRVQYGYSRSAPFTIPLKEDGTPYPSDQTGWPFGSGPINQAFGLKPCSVANVNENLDAAIRGGCLRSINSNEFQSFFSNVPGNVEWSWSTTSK